MNSQANALILRVRAAFSVKGWTTKSIPEWERDDQNLFDIVVSPDNYPPRDLAGAAQRHSADVAEINRLLAGTAFGITSNRHTRVTIGRTGHQA